MKIKPRLIIGLGNPGKEYEKTYHNVGQLFVSWIMNHETWSIKHKLFMASKIRIHDSCLPTGTAEFMIHIVKPRTFMNESGRAILAALKYFSAKPEELLVIHDDADLLLGKYKLSLNQGSAGHKGIESIIKTLGTKNFYRLRIGIRPPLQTTNYKLQTKPKAKEIVLKKIKKQELLVLSKVFKEIIQNELIKLQIDVKLD